MDINELMKKAQEMQNKMQDTQEKLADAKYEGQSGGGMVKVIINGKGEMTNLAIDPSLIKDNDAEIIGDLIVAGFNKAKKNADEAAESSMTEMLQGMGVPPGFKPF